MPADPRPEWVLARRHAAGHRIAALRAARGWSVDDLASAAGVSRLTVIRAENGYVSTGLDILLQLAEALRMPVGEMLSGE